MANHSDIEIFDTAVKIAIAAVGASGEKSGCMIVNHPESTTDYIQAVYDKLKEINDSIS